MLWAQVAVESSTTEGHSCPYEGERSLCILFCFTVEVVAQQGRQGASRGKYTKLFFQGSDAGLLRSCLEAETV